MQVLVTYVDLPGRSGLRESATQVLAPVCARIPNMHLLDGSDSFSSACGSQDAKVSRYLGCVPQPSERGATQGGDNIGS